VRGSTAPILTVSWAMAHVDASAPTANTIPSVTDLRIMGFRLCWVELGPLRVTEMDRKFGTLNNQIWAFMELRISFSQGPSKSVIIPGLFVTRPSLDQRIRSGRRSFRLWPPFQGEAAPV